MPRGGRSARSLSDSMQASSPWTTSAPGRGGEEQVHRAALVGLDVGEGDPAQVGERHDSRDGVRHEREELAHAGVEQERLLVAHEELVEA